MATMQKGLKGSNLFEYCENNAINRNDKTGLWSFKLTRYRVWQIMQLIVGIKLLHKYRYKIAKAFFVRLLTIRISWYASKVATIMCTALAIVIVGIIAYYAYKFANGLSYAAARGKGVKFSFKWGRLSWTLI